VRRTDKEIIDINVMEGIIIKAQICRVALCDNGVPYIVPLNFGYCDRVVYAHCAPVGRKLEIIKANNTVCVEFESNTELVTSESACKWTMRYYCVLGFGHATIITEPIEKKAALDCIMKHYSDQTFEYDSVSFDKIMVIRIDLDTMTGKASGYKL